MKRFALILLCSVASISLTAQDKYIEGKHYTIVSDSASEEKTVTEFFSMFCGHCFQFEPMIDSLKASLLSGTKFQKSHVDYLPQNNEEVGFGIVKSFIMMKELGRQEELVEKFFLAIHIAQEQIETENDLKRLFKLNGVEEEKFDELYDDEDIIDRAYEMAELWRTREILSVPTVVVNEKYRINMGTLGSLDELVEITNWLLTKH